MTPQEREEIGKAILADVGNPKFKPLEPWQIYYARSLSAAGAKLMLEHTGRREAPNVSATPPIDSDRALAVFAHECGHIALGHIAASATHMLGMTQEGAVLDTEYQATKWGMEAIERHGGEVTPEMRLMYRSLLSTYVPFDVKYGMADKVSEEAQAFLHDGPAYYSPFIYLEEARALRPAMGHWKKEFGEEILNLLNELEERAEEPRKKRTKRRKEMELALAYNGAIDRTPAGKSRALGLGYGSGTRGLREAAAYPHALKAQAEAWQLFKATEAQARQTFDQAAARIWARYDEEIKA